MTPVLSAFCKQEIHSKRLSSASRALQICVTMLAMSWLQVMAQSPSPQVQKEQPMAADAKPAFEVATIRLSDPNDPRAANGWSFESEGHRLQCRQATVLDIVSVMYGIKPQQIVGGPDWLSKTHYDITGIPDTPGVPNSSQVREMYKKLLADRFHLALHRDTRDMSIYAVTVAEGGPHLKPAGPEERTNAGNSGDRSQRVVRFTGMSMQDFARNLTLFEDRPVVDKTGLTGRYDFTLRWTYALSGEEQPDAPPSLFTAMKEQLGLQMNAAKGSAEVIVIDHLERPSDE